MTFYFCPAFNSSTHFMKVQFYLRYRTQFGESLFISLQQQPIQPLEYLNDDLWEGTFDVDPSKSNTLHWQYHFRAADGAMTTEWESERQLDLAGCDPHYIQLFDDWNPIGALENVFFTKPFHLNPPTIAPNTPPTSGDFVFRVKAPLLKPNEAVCILGHGKVLGHWETDAPILLHKDGNWWTIRLDLSNEHYPLAYKYGIWDTQEKCFLGFEDGSNRMLIRSSGTPAYISGVTHDGFVRIPHNTWRGAGVSIPVFSLRSEQSWGVGEFTDIHLLVDWAQSVGMKMIQLLPVNDTTSTHTWMDSYPYAPVSVFALHPIYINIGQVAGSKYASIWKPYSKEQQALNALDSVDYESVVQLKWHLLRQLYALQKEAWLIDEDWKLYYIENKHWLDAYAAFCWLRDTNETPVFNLWPTHTNYSASEIEHLLDPKNPAFDQIALHLFVQWHLHQQLKAAVEYAHARGLALKGDLPIGIYRNSADAWVEPTLYNMDVQAGAPPDPFAEKGQNWGFPTYNWARMQADDFAWWRQRFEQMSLYFDAFRIDHILGFFRIWSIPLDAVEGILGYFSPAIPVTEQEFYDRGIGFSYERLCKPFINQQVLHEVFSEDSEWIINHCLKELPDGRFELLPDFNTQRKVSAFFESKSPADKADKRKQGLFDLISNVVLLGQPADDGKEWKGAFRFDMDKTSSFRYLPNDVKAPLKALYIDYFYRRQDDFWAQEALEKLPALKRSTNMLVCGEDLGLVPGCVPGVMQKLGLLSLEIQRMPKAPGTAFLHPKDAPYLSVITPGTHDMRVLRGWWTEDLHLTQKFYNEILQCPGQAPASCEPWIVHTILSQHFHSPAMWAIFQLQDLLGMDETLRRDHPEDERINIPANPKHYWRYRSHVSLEKLVASTHFNDAIRTMVRESNRE